MTKLSVLMACYRQEKYVAEAIDSVLNNINYDWADAELILWDDASPDGTWGILEDYARRYPDIIRLHRSEENMGVAATAAAMVNAASGRYIMMFDHDDVLLPFDMSGELRFLDNNPEYVASYGRKQLFNEKEGLLGSSLGGPFSDFNLIYQPPLNNNAMIMRRESVLKAGNFQSTPQGKVSGAADVFMWLRLRLIGQFRFDMSFRVLHRVHPGQVTSRINHSEVYTRDYGFFMKYVSNLIPGVEARLRKGESFMVLPEKRYLVLILLGGMIRNTENAKEIESYLYYASQLAPKDNYIDCKIAEFIMAKGNYSDALIRFVNMIYKYPDLYNQMQIAGALKQVYQKLKLPEKDVVLGGMRISDEFFKLTPAAVKVLAGIRKY